LAHDGALWHDAEDAEGFVVGARASARHQQLVDEAGEEDGVGDLIFETLAGAVGFLVRSGAANVVDVDEE
jgi:hypothetical protein